MQTRFHRSSLGATLALFCLLGATVFTPVARAQGTVNFSNTSSSLVILSGGTPVPFATYTVGLLYWPADPGQVNLNGSIAGLTMIKTTANFISAGRFIGGTATTPSTTPGGANAWFALVVWKTSFGSYDAAQAAGGTDNYAYSCPFMNPTGNPNTIPPGAPAQLSGFTGLALTGLDCIPEPSVLFITALGAAILLQVRARRPSVD